jgi:hypothetical protein
MDNFTRKKFKKPGEIFDDMSKGDMSLRKREFDLSKTKKTIKKISYDGKLLKSKVEELKEAHYKLLHPDQEEKRDFIDKGKQKSKK